MGLRCNSWTTHCVQYECNTVQCFAVLYLMHFFLIYYLHFIAEKNLDAWNWIHFKVPLTNSRCKELILTTFFCQSLPFVQYEVLDMVWLLKSDNCRMQVHFWFVFYRILQIDLCSHEHYEYHRCFCTLWYSVLYHGHFKVNIYYIWWQRCVCVLMIF